MFKALMLTSLLMLIAISLPSPALSTVVFDFDDIPSVSKKGVDGGQVEVYMESLYGSNITVSQKTNAVHGPSIYGPGDPDNSLLRLGKGKGASAIVIHFEDNPINSFSVDFRMFKKAKSFTILADGEVINVQSLTKAQKKQGKQGQQTFFFDKPIHTLQFVGSKKNSFAIDNLVVDLPTGGSDGNGAGLIITNPATLPFEQEEEKETESNQSNSNNPGQNTPGTGNLGPSGLAETETIAALAVPEPGSLLLLGIGLSVAALRSAFNRRRS